MVYIGVLIASVFWILVFSIVLNLMRKDNKALVALIKKYAQGNFLAENDQKLRFTSNKRLADEIGALQKTMKDWLYNMLKSELELSKYAKMLQENAEESLKHMSLIESQINIIKGNSHQIASASLENASVSEELQSANDQMANDSHEYMEVTEGTIKNIKVGKRAIVGALEGIDEVELKMKSSVDKVNALQDMMDAIQTMTQGISKISDQTNLLALNASIESARAGEAGRGFAVVANEVTKLADESSRLAEDIDRKVMAIAENMKAVVIEIDGGMKTTQALKGNNQEAISHLDEMVKGSESMLTFIRNISIGIQEQLKATEVLSGNVEKLAGIAADSDGATVEAGRDVEDHRHKTNENAVLAQSIKGISQSLNAFVQMFDEALNEELFSTGEKLADIMKNQKIDNAYLQKFSKETGISEFYITDENGVTVLSNNPAGIGFTIENDPTTQAYPFYAILKNPKHTVSQSMMVRDIDGKYFKFVGLSRTDQSGIIQLGLSLEDLLKFRGRYALL
ncbi:MAG: hypothetical protein K8R73_16510 [Clostridiales bacterium]|nr:hypothetical protein [Clostridiales bacterium]